MTMPVHVAAVGVLAGIALVVAWAHAVELFIAWYSGVEPALTKWQIAGRVGTAGLALVAVVAALTTL